MTYVQNCYSTPGRLFIIGGLKLQSQEGTTQGDPLGIAIYAITITPMMKHDATCDAQQPQQNGRVLPMTSQLQKIYLFILFSIFNFG